MYDPFLKPDCSKVLAKGYLKVIYPDFPVRLHARLHICSEWGEEKAAVWRRLISRRKKKDLAC